MPAKQSHRWTVTWNNYSEEDVTFLQNLHGEMHLRYIVIGREIAPSSGTPHLQIYLETRKKMTRTGLLRLLGKTVHVEQALGTAIQNLEYCSKSGDVIVLGSPLSKGQRTDLEELKTKIKAGATWEDLWESHFSLMLQYRRGLEEYSNLCRLRRVEPPKVYIWWGATGTGKTKGAFELAREQYNDSYWIWGGSKWFDGYRGQRVAIFDEFHGGEEQGIPFALWKKLTDRYPLQVEVKGSMVNWCPEVIIFTSNLSPDSWWRYEKAMPLGWKDQRDRRITEIKEFTI